MGLFDSYYLDWADGKVEVQTQEYDPMMRGFHLGSRPPIEDEFAKTPDFWTLSEGFVLESRWSAQGLGRIAVLAHWEGVFCDFAVVKNEQEIPLAESALEALWSDPAWRSEGLSRLNDLARHSAAHYSELAKAHSTLARAWTAQRKAQIAKEQGQKDPLFGFGLGLSVDFQDKPLEQRWEEIASSATPSQLNPMTPRWRSARMPAPPEPKTPIDPRLTGGWCGGEIERPRLRSLPHPSSLPLAERALIDALRSGRLDRAESVCLQWPAAAQLPAAQAELRLWLPRACLSAMFRDDAARVMIASGVFPDIELESGSTLPALDWLASRSGPQSGAIEALLLAGAPASPALPMHFLTQAYLPLLPLALGERLADAPRDEAGVGLLETAALWSSHEAVQAVLALGADPKQLGSDESPIFVSILRLASLRAPKSSSASDSYPPCAEELCALAFIERGAIEAFDAEPGPWGGLARSLLTPALAAAFAAREAEGIEASAPSAGLARPRPSL